ncbi:MAG: FecR domain-containing protein [Bdellovibrionales bacterium]
MILRWMVFVTIGILLGLNDIALANNCACEEIVCTPCQQEIDVKFYTENCGNKGQVKSCKKPVCQDISPLPKHCQATLPKTQEPPKSVTAVKPEVPAVKKSVGTVLSSLGQVTVFREKIENPLKLGQGVFNEDIIRTGEDGKIKIMFLDKTTVSLIPKSKTQIQYEGKPGESKTLLDLMYGTIRSTVTSNQEHSEHFQIRTPSAVAGVRGTDFITTYYETSKITKVQTLEGSVELKSLAGKNKVLVSGGYYASYVIDKEHQGSDSSSMKYLDAGFLTPLEKLTPDQKNEILSKTQIHTERTIAAHKTIEKTIICRAPAAKFNECSWTCKNNPQGAKTCRTDLPRVSCVRKRCDANGNWSDDQRLPASDAHKCEATITTSPCDY